jgi:hypothetical protein
MPMTMRMSRRRLRRTAAASLHLRLALGCAAAASLHRRLAPVRMPMPMRAPSVMGSLLRHSIHPSAARELDTKASSPAMLHEQRTAAPTANSPVLTLGVAYLQWRAAVLPLVRQPTEHDLAQAGRLPAVLVLVATRRAHMRMQVKLPLQKHQPHGVDTTSAWCVSCLSGSKHREWVHTSAQAESWAFPSCAADCLKHTSDATS